ncbi:sugar ABC transporter permease [Brachybacterium phenoliresistens]|uniref:Sugar ABC transporter permease n=1 Tax=Brachybacterium phenoliresistens TaxID=396014 RepID=Z9JW98_9MICO|nr:carbohydrate ABC transporter permease [Brachybacterium phenoliresistens]EWS82303.1 sugar ABC transporter permease [Brachybacterium phenoliresistens]
MTAATAPSREGSSMSTTVTAPGRSPVGTSGPRPAARRGRRRPEGFTVASYIVVGLAGLASLVPFWMIVAGSFTDESVLARQGYSLWPTQFSTAAYEGIFSGSAIYNAYFASGYITIVGTICSVLSSVGIAWVIARRSSGISRPLAIFAYIPMLFSGGLVPTYLLVTQVLHLQNTWWAVILPHMITPFLVFVTVAFFQGIPEEILDAARVDGAGELRIFFRIVLPLSKPILAVLALFYAVAYWNEWFNALLYISNPDFYPLQLLLQNLITNVSNASQLPASASGVAPVYQLRLALTIVTIGPILLAYPFAQRYFVKGLTLGASKG